jgi:hypothetical protein
VKECPLSGGADGLLKTLRDVVEFYARQSTVVQLELNEREIDDVLEYLKSR